MALTARCDGPDEHAVADAITFHAGPELMDAADGLVPDHEARFHGVFAAQYVQIGATDGRKFDTNHGFANTCVGHRHGLERDAMRAAEQKRLHRPWPVGLEWLLGLNLLE